MGVIRNVLETVFKTKGADKVVKDTDHIGRAQTRLGQSSAATSRQFAAQSQGLGGLVAAYAGAAATIFALQAAFDALSRAAANENIIKGTSALAAETAQNGPRILESMKAITQSQVTLAEAAQNANIAISAGFNTEQIEGLTRVSLQASKALGRNLTDSLQRVVRGTAKLEPELLDELGIFVKLGPATAAYAAKLGVATNSLSEFERRQAFANAAIEEGTRKFSSIDTTAPSAQKSLEQLQVTITELSNEFLLFVAQVLQPVADFFKNDMSNALVLFAGVLALVFSKGVTIIGGFVSESTSGVVKWADAVTVKLQEQKGNFAAVEAAAKSLNKEIEKGAARGGLAGKDGSGRFNQTGVKRDVANEAASARRRFLEGEKLSIVQQQKDIQSLRAAQEQLAVSTGKNTLAYKDANRIITIYETSLQKATLTTRAFAIASNALSKSLSFLAKWGSRLLGAFNWVFLLSSAADLLGFDIFGNIINYFRDTAKTSKLVETGLTGLFATVSGGSNRLREDLEALGATDETFDKLGNTIKTTIFDATDAGIASVEDQKNILVNELANTEKELRIQLNSLKFPGLFASDEAKREFNRQEAELKARLSQATQDLVNTISNPPEFSSTAIQEGAIASIEKQLNTINNKIKNNSDKITEEDLINKAILERVLKFLEKYNVQLAGVIGSLSASSGLSAEKVANLVDDRDIAKITRAGRAVEIFGQSIELTGNGAADLEKLSESQRAFIETSLLIENTLRETSDAYNAGAADSNVLSAAIAGIRSQLLSLPDDLNALTEELLAQGLGFEEVAEKIASVTRQQKDLENLIGLRDELKNIEDSTKGIGKEFSSDISALDDLSFKGLINSSGVFAKNQEEINKNQANLLLNTLKATEADAKRKKEILDGSKAYDGQYKALARINANAERYDVVMKAVAGRLVSIRQETENLVKEQIALNKELLVETDILTQQLAIIEKEAANDLANAKRQATIDLMQEEITRTETLIDLEQKRIDNAIQRATFINELQQNEDAKIPAGLADKRIEGFKQAVSQINLTIDGKEAADLIVGKLKEGADANKAIAEYEAQLQFAIQQERLKLFDAETFLIAEKLNAEKANLETQIEILKSTAELDKARIEARKAAIEAEAAVIEAQIKGFQAFAGIVDAQIKNTSNMGAVVDAFGTNVVNLGSVLSSFLSSIPGLSGILVPDKATVSIDNIGSAQDLVSGISSDLTLATAKVAENTSIQLANLDAEKASIDKVTALRIEALETEKSVVEDKIRNLASDRSAQRQALKEEFIAERDAIQNTIDEIESGLGRKGGGSDKKKETENKIRDMLLAVFDGIEGAINSALMSFNNLILYGEGNISEIFANLFKSIQQTLFQETIANPLSNFLTEKVLGISRKGIENAVVLPDGSLKVSMSNFADMAIPGLDNNKAVDPLKGLKTGEDGIFGGFFKSITNLFSGIFGEGGIFASIFGSGGFFSRLFGGAGSAGGGGFFSNIFGAIFGSLFGGKAAAGGGLIHLAQGGRVAGLRDSVPAMLEPGEFVIRKPMVKEIGLQNLQSINATGKVSEGNVQVNVNNQGSPKDAQVSPPRFDGEKYVIDVVMRDLSNNGPIRRSLRGGR